ncbi:MAG: bifunctional 4-hydroxy-3-methylbut-2-enyl diphosphate reductase/30S ribosomal protein S1 [Firmicutes bacterium]|nr:bifunctional 4-hydroxy-3-methylbut-2-enyl diphosphate reductase/30S ribosomal protein S1 [Bacillota bacterium]
MQVILAEHAGFCGGVKRAVDLALEKAASGPVYALGPLAHNESLIDKLKQQGVIFVDSLDEVPSGATVLVRTHGERPEVFQAAEAKDLQVINATCVYVQKLQSLVADLIAEGQQVIIVGNRQHPEIRGVLGWGQDKPFVLQEPDELELLALDATKPVAVVAQTTQRLSILEAIVEKLKEIVPVVNIYNTICKATARRQEAARQLAKVAEVMIVIGSKTSNNTRKLAEICRLAGAKTIAVESAGDLDPAQLQGVRTVGVTAGASTPDWLIKEVIGKMEENKKNLALEEEQTPEEQTPEEQAPAEEAPQEQILEEAAEEETPVEQQAETVAEATAEVAEETTEETEAETAGEEVSLEAALPEFSVGDIVKGTVVQVSDEEALIDIGYKSEGVLPRQEIILSADQTLSDVLTTGQELEVAIKRIDNKEDKVLLSRRSLERKQRWAELEEAFNNGTVLTGKVKETVQAGMVIDLGGGYDGFMPGSLVDIRYIPDFNEFLGQEVSFKIIEMRKEREKLILSRKVVLEEEAEARKQEVLNSLEPGQIIKGTVKRLTNFGAFVDVGGIDGLVHISEISWQRIDTPGDVLSVGDEIEVKVTEVIPERERIGLSLRQAQPDPWTQIDEKFKPGDIVEGKVTRTVDFGAFVELIPGVEGLVHISQLANYHVKQTTDVVQQGDVVKVKILDINTEAKRVSLSMREANPRPKREPQPKVQQETTGGTGLTLGDVFGDLFDEMETKE